MEPPFDIAADLDTPVSAYLKLASFQPRFLLESVEGGERLARYSFLGFGDAVEIRLDGAGFHIGSRTQPRPGSRAELLDYMRTALAATPELTPVLDGLPFQGGMVGAAAYDIVRHFERLPGPSTPAGSQPEAVWLAPSSVLVFDHLTRRAALLHAGSETERQAVRRDVVRALQAGIPARRHGGFALPDASMSGEAFMDAVEAAKRHIRVGDVYQLVLSICFSGECSLHPFEAYRALRLLNPSPYMYFLEFGDTAIAGSSPEALVRLNGRSAALRPIAGTRPRGETAEEDREHERELLADPKEAAEHVMLVDLARNDLGRVGVPGSIRVKPSRAIERYSHVMHLVSGVEGELEAERDAFDLFAATFPAGTLVGAPKVKAMELIDTYEPCRRGFYAGTVGYFDRGGGMDQAIAIRTLVFDGQRYSYQSGAGIVADSTPANEYAEVMAKSAILKKALEIAREGL
ncbi:MAG: anthranilate synthase component I family protein [Gammaproteobacteria bacterium]|nr:MAG: anthranilate synthase component I family protein [Gammaproteobacteria bacterium]